MARRGRDWQRLRREALGLAAAGLFLAAQPAPAHADWREEFGTLRIGMVSPSGGRGVAGLQEMTTAFERATGVPVEILVARDFPALIQAQVQRRVHYAVYSAVAYAAADALCHCIEPVAAPRGVDGAIGLRAVIVARQSSIETLADAAGARVVTGPEQGLGPQSLALSALMDARASGHAGSIVAAASQAAAEQAFGSGDADVLIGWQPAFDKTGTVAQTGTLARLAASGMPQNELRVVWTSNILPNGPHAVLKAMPEELKRRLSRFLLNLKEQQPDVYHFLEAYRGGGFAPAAMADYEPALKIVAELAASDASR